VVCRRGDRRWLSRATRDEDEEDQQKEDQCAADGELAPPSAHPA
jgi:hypothetical protein